MDQRARNAAAEAMACLASAPAASSSSVSHASPAPTTSTLSPAGSSTPPPMTTAIVTSSSVSISPSDQHSHADKYSDYDRHFMKKFFGSDRRTRCDSSQRESSSSGGGGAADSGAACSAVSAADEHRDSPTPLSDSNPTDMSYSAGQRDNDTSGFDPGEPAATKRIHLETDRLSPSTRPADDAEKPTPRRPVSSPPGRVSDCPGDAITGQPSNNVVDRPRSTEHCPMTSSSPSPNTAVGLNNTSTDRTEVTDR